jgi:hypothetical protein
VGFKRDKPIIWRVYDHKKKKDEREENGSAALLEERVIIGEERGIMTWT